MKKLKLKHILENTICILIALSFILIVIIVSLECCISEFNIIRNENLQRNVDIENLIGEKVIIVNDTFMIISKGKNTNYLKISNGMEIDFNIASKNIIK